MVTVENLIELFADIGRLQFFIIGTDEIYEFPMYCVPIEIEFMEIASIDNPEFSSEPHRLCINLDIDNFEDYDGFKNQYSSHLI